MKIRGHRRRRHLWSFASLFAAVAVSCVGVSLIFLYQTIRNPINQTEQFLVVTPGTGAHSLATQLVSESLAGSSWSVLAWAVLSGTSGTFKSGEYLIPKKTSPAQILGKISRGDVYQRKLTIVEGLRFSQLRDRLGQEKMLTSTLADLPESGLTDYLSLNAPSVEGAFFPSTYFFLRGDSDVDVLRRAAAKMREELASAWDARGAGLLLKNPYEALILASIIQKEAMLESEMPRISGVFHNRLRLKMRLQTDPTVIFGLGPSFKGPLKRSHLKKDTPYNTYTRNGLPPGPISLPGRAALLAAVNPLETEDLYFMAKGDGSHEFSRTLKEHNRAVKKYRR